jgi:hypothetical protein
MGGRIYLILATIGTLIYGFHHTRKHRFIPRGRHRLTLSGRPARSHPGLIAKYLTNLR